MNVGDFVGAAESASQMLYFKQSKLTSAVSLKLELLPRLALRECFAWFLKLCVLDTAAPVIGCGASSSEIRCADGLNMCKDDIECEAECDDTDGGGDIASGIPI